ncbi:MAG: hypothetical protein N4A76_00175 [Firmicutes bacterium]|jgi:energy-coupling factor transport system substrate-specific component|nr:hypothetical protein [Bacillota bacterium]
MNNTKETTSIALGVSSIIAGGICIFLLSSLFPIPGSKYMLMAPYLSMVLYIMQSKIASKYTILKFGAVFSLIMSIVNFFMGMAILATTLLTELVIFFIKDNHKKALYGSIFFATFTGVCATLITKLFIDGLMDNMPYYWIIAIAIVCSIFGVAGTNLAKKILKNMNIST